MAVAVSSAVFRKNMEPYKRVLGILLRPTCVSIAVSDKHLSQAAPVGAVLLRDMRVPTRVLARMLAPYSKELTGVVWGHELLSQSQVLADQQAAGVLSQVQRVVQEASPSLPTTWWEQWAPDGPAACHVIPPNSLSAAPGEAPDPGGSSVVTPPSSSSQHQEAPESAATSQQDSAPAGATALQPKVQVGAAPGDVPLPASTFKAAAAETEAAAAAETPGLRSAAGCVPCSMGTLFLQHFLESTGSQNTSA